MSQEWKKKLDKALQDEYDRCANGLSFRFETIREVFRNSLAQQRQQVIEEVIQAIGKKYCSDPKKPEYNLWGSDLMHLVRLLKENEPSAKEA